MKDDEICSITIVGGGVAGGLTALFLRRFLRGRVRIRVIAPTSLPPMTVGESTNGPFTGFLDSLGITRSVLVSHCDATIKVASQFANWSPQGQGYQWTHEFQGATLHAGIPLFHYWLKKARDHGGIGPYQTACFTNEELIRQCRVPFESVTAEPRFPYGYHINGTKLSAVLHRQCVDLGVQWDDDEVLGVSMKENGHIDRLECRSGEQIVSDLFIDCTGFKRRLMTLAYGDPFETANWESFSDHLSCDSAVFFTLPHQNAREIRPSTLGTALSSGWVWDIPLQGCVSLGYVYSSAHLTREEAELEFRQFVGQGTDKPLGYLRWKTGMLRDAWVGNCIAIGVANSFVEPIESLTSATLTVELRNLLLNFPNSNFNDAGRRRYNQAIRRQCHDNRDFISLHYATSGRDDTPFWSSRKTAVKSERVRDLLEDYKVQAPHVLEGIYSIKAIFGMFTSRGIVPRDDFPLLNYVDWAGVDDAFETIRKDHAQLAEQNMSHSVYLESLRQFSGMPSSFAA